MFRLAVRRLLQSPGFAIVAVITLALGLGVNTAMFSVVNTLLFQPAPYPAADQLVRVYRTSPQAQNWPHSLPDFRDLRDQNRSFAALAAFTWSSYSLAEPGQPAQRLDGAAASADLFAAVGVQPMLGRAFTAEEQLPGRDRVTVLSHRYWQEKFHGDPGAIGQTLRINGEPVVVIGVLPPQFEYPEFWGRPVVWRPLTLADDWRQNRDIRWLQIIGRLQPGITLDQAGAEVSAIAARLARDFPATNAGDGLRLVPLHESTLDDVSRNLTWLTLGLAGFVLLIACANLANLQLARSAARGRDLAIRAALGASRWMLIRHILAESLVLAFVGGVAGLLLAGAIVHTLGPTLAPGRWAGAAFELDFAVLGFALLVAFAAGVLSGCVPAWLASRPNVNGALKQQARGSTGDRSRHHLRHALIVLEIAFSLLLLAGSGFFIRGLQRLAERDLGWQTHGLLAGNVSLPESTYATDEVRRQWHDRLLERVKTLPGVEHAAISTSMPLSAYNIPNGFAIEGPAEPPPGQEPLAYQNMVSPDFFATLGIQLVDGRVFPATLQPDDPRVVVINESMARQFWPGESAVGKRVRSTNPGWRPWLEVIGVVRDVGFATQFGPVPTPFQIYHPLTHNPWGYVTITLRSNTPEALAEPLRRAVTEFDAEVPVAYVRTVRERVADAQAHLVTVNQLLAGFAALGLVLAAIGLYGVISSLVVQRTQEFGIRLALGAQPRDVLWMVLGKGAALTLGGVVLGLAGAVAMLRVLAAIIPGLPGQDFVGLAGVVVLLFVVTLVATFLPARRATKVNPLTALRSE